MITVIPIHPLLAVAALIGAVAGEQLTERKLDTLWSDLATRDAYVAQQAIAAFVARGEKTVAFLGKRLEPVRRPGPACLARLIGDLDSNAFRVRENATQELERMGPPGESALREALAGRPSLEVRRRIERILETHRRDRLQPPTEQLRRARAVEILEQIDSAAARRMLETYAFGDRAAPLTRDAKGALERLAGKSAISP